MTKRRWTPYLLLSPLLLIYVIFIGGGFLMVGIESLGHIPVLGMKGYSLGAYAVILRSRGLLHSLMLSGYVAIISAIIATALGVTIAYFIISSRAPLIQLMTKRALQLGVMLPYLYAAFIAMLFLNQSGFFARLLYSLGLLTDITSFPELIFDKRGIGLIWVFVLKGTPFVALFTMNVMGGVSRVFGDVARTLGAKSWSILRRIYLPLCQRAIIWSSAIILAYAFGSFEVNYLLGSVSPTPLAARAYSLFIQPDIGVIPLAMAMNVIMLIVGLALVTMYALLLKLVIGRAAE